MKNRALEYVQKHNMLSHGDKIAAGVSGGADSMCLLSLLLGWQKELDLQILVIHINHGIRGAEADADERFVSDYCKEHGVEFVAVHANIPALAAEKGLTEEEAGRMFRYETFYDICLQRRIGKLAVAHNLDDNAETLLFNLCRGSGIAGARGIPPIREINGIKIVRPLLACSRRAIEEYLTEKGESFRTDSTNLTSEYSRNLIRNEVLPILKDGVNARTTEHLAAFAQQAAEIERFIEEETDEAIAVITPVVNETAEAYEVRANVVSLLHLKPIVRRSVLKKLLGTASGSLKDIESTHVAALEDLLEKATGRSVNLPYDVIAARDYDELVLQRSKVLVINANNTKTSEEEFGGFCGELICIPGKYELGQGLTLELNIAGRDALPQDLKNNYTKYFDYDKIKGGISVRTRRQGDYLLVGNEKKHRKSLKSWMIDNKISRSRRDELLLLAADSEVLWVIGERRCDAYQVTETTEEILVARLLENT